MLKLSLRCFASNLPPLQASHRFSLPKTKNQLGLSRNKDNIQDPDRLSKLQKLVKEQLTEPGFSLSESVKKLAKTDEEFNNFLKEFRTKEEPK